MAPSTVEYNNLHWTLYKEWLYLLYTSGDNMETEKHSVWLVAKRTGKISTKEVLTLYETGADTLFVQWRYYSSFVVRTFCFPKWCISKKASCCTLFPSVILLHPSASRNIMFPGSVFVVFVKTGRLFILLHAIRSLRGVFFAACFLFL